MLAYHWRSHTGGYAVSNPFKTGRYGAVVCSTLMPAIWFWFQTPSKRGGTVLPPVLQVSPSKISFVSNPFKTGRYGAAWG